MSTLQWMCICGIAACVSGLIGLILGCLMAAAKDENKARECAKCREAMQSMARKLVLVAEGKENDDNVILR